jgi:8-oxo-dGTP pyrophosphatase MutT (NUDIX family)
MTEAAAALIWKKDRSMIGQRNKAEGFLWANAGGKIEPGEAKEQPLVRARQEELAATISDGMELADRRVKGLATFDGEPDDGSIVNRGMKHADGSVCSLSEI